MRDIARRARQLAGSLPDDADRERIIQYARDLEEEATRLERDA